MLVNLVFDLLIWRLRCLRLDVGADLLRVCCLCFVGDLCFSCCVSRGLRLWFCLCWWALHGCLVWVCWWFVSVWRGFDVVASGLWDGGCGDFGDLFCCVGDFMVWVLVGYFGFPVILVWVECLWCGFIMVVSYVALVGGWVFGELCFA